MSFLILRYHRFLFILIFVNFVIITIKADATFNEKTCQSGLREDNTNYIYCARQNLNKIPNFFNELAKSNQLISNVIYDELVLSDNLINSIDKDAFGLNLKVKKLYLDQNPIRFIHDHAFDRLRNYLEELYIDQKVLNEVSSFTNNPAEFIDYEYTSLKASEMAIKDDTSIFEASIFKTCFNLRVLSLKNYLITKLKAYKFFKLNKVETLHLIKLKIKHIDPNAFTGLEQSLVELKLDSNYLESVPTTAFTNLKRLKRLSLSQNRIKTLHSNAFFGFNSRLQFLDLSYNYLSKLEEKAFAGSIQQSLSTLQIQNNELKWTDLIEILFNLPSLTELNIDFNKLFVNQQSFATSLLDTENNIMLNRNTSTSRLKLELLSMQGNSLSEKSLNALMSSYDYNFLLKNELLGYELTKPEKAQLELADFQMKTNRDQELLSKRELIFQFTNLLKLNLARNKIEKIPKKFFIKLNMTSLKALTLDRNQLDLNEKTFEGLESSLESLNLNNVGFDLWSKNATSSLNVLKNLKVLKLNGNSNQVRQNQQNSADLVLDLRNLKTLELQNNNLKKLPEFMCNLDGLVDLDLSSNQLNSFNSNCLLFKLNNGVYESSKLKQLNLNNNPLKCDCKLRQLKIWLSKNYEKDLLDLIKWKCAEPFELRNEYLNGLSLNNLICQQEEQSTLKTKIQPFTTKTLSIKSSFSPSQTKVQITQQAYLYNQMDDTHLEVKNSSLSNKEVLQKFMSNEQPEKLLHSSASFQLNYYSLIIGVSFGISIVCLVLLIAFYFLCIRNQQKDLKTTFDYINNNSLNDKYENKKFCSPSTSTTSCSSSSVGSTIFYPRFSKENCDLMDVNSNATLLDKYNTRFSLINSNGLMTNESIAESDQMNHYNHLKSFNQSQQILFTNNQCQNQRQKNSTMQSANFATTNHYNNLNYESSVYSIETDSNNYYKNNESHIYHEINQPSRALMNQSNRCELLQTLHNHQLMNKNNNNNRFLLAANPNSLNIRNQSSFNPISIQQPVVLNDFTQSLFV